MPNLRSNFFHLMDFRFIYHQIAYHIDISDCIALTFTTLCLDRHRATDCRSENPLC